MMKRFFSLLPALLLFLPVWLSAQVDPTTLDGLVIQSGGRQKPFGVFTAETLQSLTGKKEFKPSFSEKILPAGEVLLEIWFNPQKWSKEEIILVDYQPLRKLLGMDGKKKLASFESIVSNQEFVRAFESLQKQKRQKPNDKLDPLQKDVESVSGRLHIFEGLVSGDAYRVIPPAPNGSIEFIPVQLLGSAYQKEQALPVAEAFDQMRSAYLKNDPSEFKVAATRFKELAGGINPAASISPWKVHLENFYFKFHPFRWAWIAYLGAFVSLLAIMNQKKGYRIAWALVLTGLLLQISGFVMRIIISERAPVTNMYETVIWLSFGVSIFAIILEWKYRCRYYLLGALPVSILSLLLADSLPNVLNDSIRPLMPVLQHNFWLTVHVLMITSSYAAFALALGVAHIILGKVLFSKKHTIEASLYNYLYKTIQIGVLLLAIGTILGGVWANYSWGRFWDWDPKETWALVAFMSYLFILHGRIAGWWGGFGLAIGSVIGFMAILMAWYGVNFVLGVGLHSYGFGAGGIEYALAFVIAELIFAGAALYTYTKIKTQTRTHDKALDAVDKN